MIESRKPLAAAVFAALLAALPAARTLAQPALHSGGLTEEDARRIFGELLEASSVDQSHWLSEEQRNPTQFRFMPRFQTLNGSPAVAIEANTGVNKDPCNCDIVAAGYGLLEIAAGEDQRSEEAQLAFILAHEISHLASDDSHTFVEFKEELFNKWYEKNEERTKRMDDQAIVAAFTADTGGKFNVCKKHREEQADGNGLLLMGYVKDAEGRQKYPGEFAAQSMANAKEWLASFKGEHVEDQTHAPLLERVKYLKRWAAKLDGAAKKLDGMSTSLGSEARAGGKVAGKKGKAAKRGKKRKKGGKKGRKKKPAGGPCTL